MKVLRPEIAFVKNIDVKLFQTFLMLVSVYISLSIS